MGVLFMVMTWEGRLSVPEIASLVDVARSVVEEVVYGPTKELFQLDGSTRVFFAIPYFKDFLLDANRAGEFYIPPRNLKTRRNGF